ncbi:MAG: hypothetical protein ACXQS6_04785 [Candidatus Syntropharchaeales archaeon]|nr:hypothetical protein [Candidatus Syntrophoarchaeum sp.]
MNAYELRLLGTVMVLVGAFLTGEHIYRWGFEPYDLVGHEWYGIALFIGVCGYHGR